MNISPYEFAILIVVAYIIDLYLNLFFEITDQYEYSKNYQYNRK